MHSQQCQTCAMGADQNAAQPVGQRPDCCGPSLAPRVDFLIWRDVNRKCMSSEGSNIPRSFPTTLHSIVFGLWVLHLPGCNSKGGSVFSLSSLSLPIRVVSSMTGVEVQKLCRHSEPVTRAPISWSRAQVHPVKDKWVASTLLGFCIGSHSSLVTYKLITRQKWLGTCQWHPGLFQIQEVRICPRLHFILELLLF